MDAGYEARIEPSPWWLLLLQGVAALILGLLLLAQPAATTVVVVQVIGWYWLITGILGLVMMFVDTHMWGLKLAGGILGVIAGLLVIQSPLIAAVLVPATLVVILGILGLIIGGVGLVTGFSGGGWGIGLMGALSVLIGLVLLSNVFTTTLAVPLVFGILGVGFGIAGIVAAFRVRSMTSTHGGTMRPAAAA